MSDDFLPPVDELPVLDDLKLSTRFTLSISNSGHVLLFYNKPLLETVDYVEFDLEGDTVMFVYDTGRIQNIGIGIPADMHHVLIQNDHIFLVQMENRQVRATVEVPFFVKTY